jgi:hypothetical protein
MAVQSKPAPIGPWGKATAGAAGAVFANALAYPLDLYVKNDGAYVLHRYFPPIGRHLPANFLLVARFPEAPTILTGHSQ